jgi:UDP-N-acetylmuramate dehydrogenase
MLQLIAELEEAGVGDVRLAEPLAPYTTWKIGGPADILLVPQTKEQLVRAVSILSSYRVARFVLGRGSNMLVADKGIRGVVIKLGDALDYVRFDGNLVYAGGAYSFITLCQKASRHGLTGLEFAGGIPGSVGGAVYMNAGAHGSDVSHILKQAEVLLDTGELVTMSNEDLHYAYRHSALHRAPGIVTEAVFELAYGDRGEISAALASYKERRRRTQPLHLPCAGSVFRNPENGHAAKYIEEAGLKGMRVGGAEVSVQHANFIINTGGATANDVLTLIKRVQQIVADRFQVTLAPEVLIVGEWS